MWSVLWFRYRLVILYALYMIFEPRRLGIGRGQRCHQSDHHDCFDEHWCLHHAVWGEFKFRCVTNGAQEHEADRKAAIERAHYEEENAIELHLKKFGLGRFAKKVREQGFDTLAALAELDTHEILISNAFLMANVGIKTTKDTAQMYQAMAALGNHERRPRAWPSSGSWTLRA